MNSFVICSIIDTKQAKLAHKGEELSYIISQQINDTSLPIELSFEGLELLTSSFVKSLVCGLAKIYGDQYSVKVKEKGLDNSVWKEKYDEAVDRAINPQKYKEENKMINSLLDSNQ